MPGAENIITYSYNLNSCSLVCLLDTCFVFTVHHIIAAFWRLWPNGAVFVFQLVRES